MDTWLVKILIKQTLLNKVFNKELKEKDRKEGLLRRLANIEDKNKNPSSNDVYFNSENVYNKIEKQDKKINNRRFVLVGSCRLRYDVSQFLNV